MNKKDQKPTEIETLNLDDLDVEELEQRLELAAASYICDCGTNTSCGSNKKTV